MAKDLQTLKPFARTKRSHRKSRLGCILCKQRRVKCDEQQPECTHCSIHGAECVYPLQPPVPASNKNLPRISPKSFDDTSSGSGGPVTGQESVSPLPRSPSSSIAALEADLSETHLSSSFSVSDAELSQHYLQIVAPTFSRYSVRTEQHWIWHVFVPSLAYNYPTVRHGLLTLAAMSLHFSSQDLHLQQQGSTQYLEAAVAHGDMFIKQSRSQIAKLQPADANANAASSRLLSVLAFAFFRHYRQVGVMIDEHQSWTWLHLLRGVQTVHMSLLKCDQNVDPMIKQDMMPELFSFATPPLIELLMSDDTQVILAFIDATRSERFEMLYAGLSDGTFAFDKRQQVAASAAITSLARVTDHICKWNEMNSLFRSLCTWPGDLSEDFVRMLTQCNLSALAIYTHWLMLVALAEDMWWLGDMGRAGISTVVDKIPPTDSGLQKVIERPRQLLNLMPLTG